MFISALDLTQSKGKYSDKQLINDLLLYFIKSGIKIIILIEIFTFEPLRRCPLCHH
jgi:hypothetical protein